MGFKFAYNLHYKKSAPLNYVSSSAGSNKTGGAIDIMKNDNPFQNYIYVTPRINLMEEVIGRCGEGRDREINPKNIIHFNIKMNKAVGTEALGFINNVGTKTNHVIFLTTITFLTIVSRIKNKGYFKLIIDEEVDPFWLQRFEVPEDNLNALNILDDLIDCNEDEELVIKNSKIKLVNNILGEVDGRYSNIYNNRNIKEILSTIKNDSILSYKLNIEDECRIYIWSYLQPKHFMEFKEVTFLCAHFNHTALYHLWVKRFKVNFKEHSLYAEKLNNLAEVQGKNVMIGYLLDSSDSASSSTLGLSNYTGKQGDAKEELVIDKILDCVNETIGNEEYLVALNKKYESKGLKYNNAKVVNVSVSGLNCYSDINNVAVLATTNPIPTVANQLCSLLDITNKKLLHLYQVHNDAQVAGRIIRDLDNEEIKTIIVLSESSAMFLNNIYKDSVMLGKIGSLPSYKDIRKNTKKLAKYELVSNEILRIQNESIVDKLSFYSIKREIEGLGFKVSNNIWRDARKVVASNDSIWKEKGYSYIRYM